MARPHRCCWLLLFAWSLAHGTALCQELPEPGEASTDQKPEAAAPMTAELAGQSRKHDHIWGGVDYLLWWTRNPQVPLLVTNGEPTDNPAGSLGQLGTIVRYGNENVDFREKHGLRFVVGYAPDREIPATLEAGYFFLNARTTGYQQGSPGNPVIARPFVNALTGQQDASVVSYPGVLQGSIVVASDSYFQGAESNVCVALWSRGDTYVSVLGGFRYLELRESLNIDEVDVVTGPPATMGSRITDAFGANNRFYGGQVGMKTGFRYRRFTLDLSGRIGFGDSQENVSIAGKTTFDNGQVVPAGLLALSSNSGQTRHDVFAVVPEGRVDFGFRLCDYVQFVAGYSFLYWSRVVRPGDQIDTTLNPNLIPTSATFGASGGLVRPAARFRETDFWAQGVNFGLQFRY